MARPTTARRAGNAAALLVAVLAGVLVLRLPGGTGLPACPLWQLTELYCAGCGITRALRALIHADLATAWAMNPLMIILLPVLTAQLLHLLDLLPARWRPAVASTLRPLPWLILLTVYSVLRNIPVHPFIGLAPG